MTATVRTSAPSATVAPRARMAGSLLAGLLLAALLFLAMAALQPAGVEGNAAQVDQAWARLSALNTPPPPPAQPERLRPKPAAPLAKSSASAASTAARTPTPPRAAPARLPQLTAPQNLPRLDPLLLGLTPSPDNGAGPVLEIDPNGTALSSAGDNGDTLFARANASSLAAVQTLLAKPPARGPVANTNRKPQWLQRIEPEYPPDALRKSQEGTVTLRLRISPEGSVLEVVRLGATCQPTPGAEMAFEEAAAGAAERSLFLPGTNSAGKATEQWVKVSYLFQLR